MITYDVIIPQLIMTKSFYCLLVLILWVEVRSSLVMVFLRVSVAPLHYARKPLRKMLIIGFIVVISIRDVIFPRLKRETFIYDVCISYCRANKELFLFVQMEVFNMTTKDRLRVYDSVMSDSLPIWLLIN